MTCLMSNMTVPLRMEPMDWTVKSVVTAVMLMDVTTLLDTAAVWLDGQVRKTSTCSNGMTK